MDPRLALLPLMMTACTTVGEAPGQDAGAKPDARVSPGFPDAAPATDVRAVPDATMSTDWGPCSVNGYPGICEDTALCDGGNVAVAHHCPGPASVQCCVASAALSDGGVPDAAARPDSAPRPDASPTGTGECPADGIAVSDTACMDLYEAPNHAGALPLVMYSFVEAENWCGARGKRLCFDDEWTSACAGPENWPYPYGATRVPGECNDAKTWRVYDQSKLNGWPTTVSTPDIESLDDLLAAASAQSPAGATAAGHVQSLYQGDGSGSDGGCVGAAGVFDLQGNVEEWTRRRDGGQPQFHGNLKGRYWAESRTCQSGVTTHGDGFRFYEIGFRCCMDR